MPALPAPGSFELGSSFEVAYKTYAQTRGTGGFIVKFSYTHGEDGGRGTTNVTDAESRGDCAAAIRSKIIAKLRAMDVDVDSAAGAPLALSNSAPVALAPAAEASASRLAPFAESDGGT